MDQAYKKRKEKGKRNQDIQAPSLPNRLATEDEYEKYCKESASYYYEVEEATINMRNYTDYVKSYKKRR